METKKCPMCAEQIPLDAAVCEYCGTILEEGDATNKAQEESTAPQKPSAQVTPTSMPVQKQSNPWVGIAIGLGAILILALVGGGVLIAQNGLSFLATPTNTPRPTSTPRPTPKPTNSPEIKEFTVEVPATALWFDTGIRVDKDQYLMLTASGTISTCTGVYYCDIPSPNGNDSPCQTLDNFDCLLNGAHYGELLGRIGDGEPFRVGSGYGMMVSESGNLFLSINDNLIYFEDNSGSYTVTVKTSATQDVWIREFARPILDDIHNRQPNFEDDFSVMSGGFVRWGEEQGVTFTGDVMRINTTGKDDIDVGGSINAHDFVLEYEFTPRIRIDGSCAYINFRWGDTGGYSFNINLNDNWQGMITIPNGKSGDVLIESWSEEAMSTQRTLVTIIAKGNLFALFINGKPLAYVVDSAFDGTWNGLGVWSPNGPAEVDFDNVKFWDLNNLNP